MHLRQGGRKNEGVDGRKMWAGAVVMGGLCLSLLAVRILSARFTYGVEPSAATIIATIGLMAAAGVAYCVLFFLIPKVESKRAFIGPMIIAGLALRLLFFWSTPVYEDDWHRYLWDGATVSAGINPYAHPPAAARAVDAFGAPIPLSDDPDLRQLQTLARAHPDLHYRINYPYVSTIYPPLTQASFAAAHAIKPMSLNAWRGVLLLVDGLSLGLLLLLLKSYGRLELWAALYWLNPVLILTTFNAGHMDILIGPFLLGALLLLRRDKPKWAAVSLAAAASVKLWPIILAPVLFRAQRRRPLSLLVTATVFCAAVAFFLSPMLVSLNPEHSGLTAYAQSWLRNAFLFPLLAHIAGLVTVDGDTWARIFVAALVIGASVFIGLRSPVEQYKTPMYLLALTSVLFVLSPTGYPWYYVWLLWFAPLAPSLGVALFSVTLPLYYARYALANNGYGWVFETILVPIEFLPPLLLLILEGGRHYGRKRNAAH